MITRPSIITASLIVSPQQPGPNPFEATIRILPISSEIYYKVVARA